MPQMFSRVTRAHRRKGGAAHCDCLKHPATTTAATNAVWCGLLDAQLLLLLLLLKLLLIKSIVLK